MSAPVHDPKWDPAVDPVLCSPYDPPDRHWRLDTRGQAIRGQKPAVGRRPPARIGTAPADQKAGAQQALRLRDRPVNTLVEETRDAVGAWRADGYPGVTATTRILLNHWADPQGARIRLFFAQREAAETIIWLREVATRGTRLRRELEEASRTHNDCIVRYCAKMATGTGKTAVMGMIIAWQTLNAARTTRRRNLMHCSRFVVFAPGHTVRRRLEVLEPSHADNVYDEMGLVPADLRARLNRARVRVVNYQAFVRRELLDSAPARKLLGKAAGGGGTESWNAAVRRVVGDLLDVVTPIDVCVINDEAHHCYPPPTSAVPRKSRSSDEGEDERAAVWFNAVRTLRDIGALGNVSEHGQESAVFDFSATPLWINTAPQAEPDQFQWVASDFGLMEAIESGLVKVPRVPIDDDSTRDETVWRGLYKHTKPTNLASWRKGAAGARDRLPEQLNGALEAVYRDYERTFRVWDEGGQPTPPVMIVVANNIGNAKAIFNHIAGEEDGDGQAQRGVFDLLSNVDEHGRWRETPRTLIVHSKVAEADAVPDTLKRRIAGIAGVKLADAEQAVREMLNTVGKRGRPGEQVRCVVSVAMLTEGWDARTVTHIVGFRAFGTQLLCEQVTGRALRRTAYDDFRAPDPDGRRRLRAEYADVVGIPFEFMPAVADPNAAPATPKPRTRVHTVDGRSALRVVWPQVVEYLTVAEQARFAVDPAKVEPWRPPPSMTATLTALSGVAGEESILSRYGASRRRTAQARIASRVVEHITVAAHIEDGEDRNAHRGARRGEGRMTLFASAFKAVEDWASHPSVGCSDYHTLLAPDRLEDVINRILDSCNMSKTGKERLARLAHPPLMDTSNVDFLTTLQHVAEAERSELSHAACHSELERAVAQQLDRHREVACWVRNFQLGWAIPYHTEGVWRRYEPDFVARLNGGTHLIIECKGVADLKSADAERWTRQHWIPAVAGTDALPDGLRAWEYEVIANRATTAHDLDVAIRAAGNE